MSDVPIQLKVIPSLLCEMLNYVLDSDEYVASVTPEK